MALKDSQTTMFQHSEVKIRLLKTYLERFLNVLNESPYIDNVFLYDLFCGEGIYDNGGKGSPMAILETIQDIHQSNRVKRKRTMGFHCLFNDLQNNKVEKLERIVSESNLHHAEIGEIRFSTEDYRDLLPKISKDIRSIKKAKAFIFIDPYGYKDIRISDIESLLDSGNSEVLLFLPTRDMFRFVEKGTPQSLKEFIEELVPENQWPMSTTGLEFIENLTDAFRKKLNSYFVDSFVISRDTNQFFCLFFFTNHIYGFDRMLDAKWGIDKEEGRGWSYESENTLFSTFEKTPNVKKFERSIEAYLRTGSVNNKQLYEFTLFNGHLPKHTNQILDKLQKEGRLKVLDLENKPVRKSSFYISYKYYKEGEKIRAKIKLQ